MFLVGSSSLEQGCSDSELQGRFTKILLEFPEQPFIKKFSNFVFNNTNGYQWVTYL